MQETCSRSKALGVQLLSGCQVETRLVGIGIPAKALLSALIATRRRICAISVVVKIGVYRLVIITDGKGELKSKQLLLKQGGSLMPLILMLDVQHPLDKVL